MTGAVALTIKHRRDHHITGERPYRDDSHKSPASRLGPHVDLFPSRKPQGRASPSASIRPVVEPEGSQLRSRHTVTPPLVAARGSRRPRQPKAATTNRVRDYQALEREFITGTMSLRELCRRHGVTRPQRGRASRRRTGRLGGEARDLPLPGFGDVHRAPRRPRRRPEAEVRDHAIEAIDEAITKFRADLQATQRKLDRRRVGRGARRACHAS